MLCCAIGTDCGASLGNEVAGPMWSKDLCGWFCCSQNLVISLAAAYSSAASCSRGAICTMVTGDQPAGWLRKRVQHRITRFVDVDHDGSWPRWTLTTMVIRSQHYIWHASLQWTAHSLLAKGRDCATCDLALAPLWNRIDRWSVGTSWGWLLLIYGGTRSYYVYSDPAPQPYRAECHLSGWWEACWCYIPTLPFAD